LVADADRSEAFAAAQAHDPPYEAYWCLVGLVVRARGPVTHAGWAVVAVSVGPAFRGRPSVVDHETREP